MIQGLVATLSGVELKNWLENAAIEHRKKTEFYEQQLAMYGDESPIVVSGEPREAIRRKVQEHKDKQGYFTFLLAHVDSNETYRLSTYELKEIGAIK
jgi:hypothetical protein